MLVGTDRAFDERNRRAFLLQAAMSDARIVPAYLRAVSHDPRSAGDVRGVPDAGSSTWRRRFSTPRATTTARRRTWSARSRRDSKRSPTSRLGTPRSGRRSATRNADIAWEAWGVDLLVVDEGTQLQARRLHDQDGRGQRSPARRVSARLRHESQASLHDDAGPVPRPDRGPRSGEGCVPDGDHGHEHARRDVDHDATLCSPTFSRKLGIRNSARGPATFTTPKPSPEMDAVGAWKVRTRLKFHNLPELQDMTVPCGIAWIRARRRHAAGHRERPHAHR